MKREEQIQFVTIPEAQRRLGVRRPLRQAIDRGELPVFDVGGWPRLSWRDVLAWIESTKRTVRDGPSGQRGAPEKRE